MKITLLIFCSLLLFVTLLPFVKKQYWVFRVCDYPRLQKLFLNLICIALLSFFVVDMEPLVLIFFSLMTLNANYLLYLILPFTKIAHEEVLKVKNHFLENGISLMISNVLQTNTNYQGCLQEIAKAQPDLVLLLEADRLWYLNTRALSATFPFEVKIPLENKYGMILYSKFELKKTEVNYLVEADIPSIHTEVILASGKKVQLFAVHPTPPVPNENPTSIERDKELMLVADLAKKSKLPIIVIGDLNDVAWSYTTELFLKMSGLLDPRKGRGFYNTFHAHYPFLRFPLDHAFVSENFKLKKIKRLSNFDSDHFLIFISLQFEEKAHLQQQGTKSDADDLKNAKEKKEEASP